MIVNLLVSARAKRALGKTQNLERSTSVTKHVEQEEIVQLVRANQVLRLLLNRTVSCSWQQLRRNWRVQNVAQNVSNFVLALLLVRVGTVINKVPDQRLWYRSIHAVHGHLVAVVCCPAKRQLREVARTNDHAAHLVSNVHQDLRAFTSLSVLVHNIVNVLVMTDVGKVLQHGIHNGNLAQVGAKRLHQLNSVGVRAVCGAKSRHCHSYNARTIISQLVKGSHRDEKSQCRVKSTRNANNRVVRAGVCQP